MRRTLTDKGVVALKPRAARYSYPDPEQRGLYVRIQPSGAKSFVAVTLDPHGKQIWATLGPTDVLPISDARERAREAIRRVRDGLAPFEAPPNKPETFEDIAEQWLKRHVQANGLRSHAELTRLLRVHVYPAWKGRALRDIRRSDVAALLDEVEDDHGARQADYVPPSRGKSRTGTQPAMTITCRLSSRGCDAPTRNPAPVPASSPTTNCAMFGKRPSPSARLAFWCACCC